MSNIGQVHQIRSIKQPKPEPRERLQKLLDDKMIVTGRGENSPKRHRVQSKYITYSSVSDEDWQRIFGGK